VTEAAPYPVLPIACSLTSQEIGARMSEWSALMREAVTVVAIEGGARASFVSDPDTAARVADLAVREQQCCPFFRFTVEIASGALALDVTAPSEARPLVAQLVGLAAN
jgi:hypothetical protein